MNDDPKTLNDEDDDDDFASVIRSAIANASTAEEGEDDGAGFDAPLDDLPKAETVSVDEGNELADDARFKDRKAAADFQKTIDEGTEAKDKTAADPDGKTPEAKPEGEADAKADKTPAEADVTAEGKVDGDGKPADLKALAMPDLLAGIDETKAAEITRRLGDAERVTGLFKGRDNELRMHGVNAEQAMSRLLYLNEFAQKKPDEYIAWVAQQMNPDKVQDVLSAAAKHLGLKVVAETEAEADEFESPEMKALREENARLKRERGGSFGPDTPERATQRTVVETLNEFVSERDTAGNLRRPHFEALKPRITQMAAEHRQKTGAFVTKDDLDRFYGAAEAEARAAFGGSAAQPADPVPQQEKTPAAAQPAQPKPASKMIDGDGQGADRRPALPQDADLLTVIRHKAMQSGE